MAGLGAQCYATAFYVRAAVACLTSRGSLVAVGVLLVNDHVLKDAYSSWLTGKLSDFAGLYFFPVAAELAPSR